MFFLFGCEFEKEDGPHEDVKEFQAFIDSIGIGQV